MVTVGGRAIDEIAEFELSDDMFLAFADMIPLLVVLADGKPITFSFTYTREKEE